MTTFAPQSRLGRWNSASMLLLIWAAIALIATIAIAVIEATAPEGSAWYRWRPLYYVVMAAVVVPAAVNLRDIRRAFGFSGQLGRALVLISAAPVVWSFGSVVWAYYNICDLIPEPAGCATGRAIPFPSLADLLYLGFYPLAVVALLGMSRALGATRRDLVKVSWLFPAFAGLTWVTVGERVFASSSLPLQTITSAAYIIGDSLVVSVALTLLWRARHAIGGAVFIPALMIALAVTALYVGDMLFFHQVLVGTYGPGGIVTQLYLVALGLIPYGVQTFLRNVARAGDRAFRGQDSCWMALVQEIIDAQSMLLGPVAADIAGKQPGVDMQGDRVVAIRQPVRTTLALLDAYEALTGSFGVKLSQAAARPVLAAYPQVGVGVAGLLEGGSTESRRSALRRLLGAMYSSRSSAIVSLSVAGAATALVIAELGASAATIALAGALAIPSVKVVVDVVRARRDRIRRAGSLHDLGESATALLEAERARIAGEIHDKAIQRIVGGIMQVERARFTLAHDGEQAADILKGTEVLLRRTVASLRETMRDLEHGADRELDIRSGLQQHAASLEESFGTQAEIDIGLAEELDFEWKVLVFRLLAELLTNAAKHGHAAHARVLAGTTGSNLILYVEDDGAGFDEPIDLVDQQPEQVGWGLRTLFNQVHALGGEVTITSRPGRGATVGIVMPLRQRRADREALLEGAS